MFITFLAMYNQNQFFLQYTWEPAKNKYKKTLLTYNKRLTKIDHELIIYNIII